MKDVLKGAGQAILITTIGAKIIFFALDGALSIFEVVNGNSSPRTTKELTQDIANDTQTIALISVGAGCVLLSRKD